jgi:hypothetical protein
MNAPNSLCMAYSDSTRNVICTLHIVQYAMIVLLHVCLCACIVNSRIFIANLQRKINNQH